MQYAEKVKIVRLLAASSGLKQARDESKDQLLGRVIQLQLQQKGLPDLELVGWCPQLRVLYAFGNSIPAMPESMLKLSNLTMIMLDDNNITEIKHINHLHKLQKLYLNGNCISVLEGLDGCVALTHLEIARQRLGEGHQQLLFEEDTMDFLSHRLERLDVSGNGLTSILHLCCLKRLKSLRVADNRLHSVKEVATLLARQWPYLQSFDSRGNPFIAPASSSRKRAAGDGSLQEQQSLSSIGGSGRGGGLDGSISAQGSVASLSDGASIISELDGGGSVISGLHYARLRQPASASSRLMGDAGAAGGGGGAGGMGIAAGGDDRRKPSWSSSSSSHMSGGVTAQPSFLSMAPSLIEFGGGGGGGAAAGMGGGRGGRGVPLERGNSKGSSSSSVAGSIRELPTLSAVSGMGRPPAGSKSSLAAAVSATAGLTARDIILSSCPAHLQELDGAVVNPVEREFIARLMARQRERRKKRKMAAAAAAAGGQVDHFPLSDSAFHHHHEQQQQHALDGPPVDVAAATAAYYAAVRNRRRGSAGSMYSTGSSGSAAGLAWQEGAGAGIPSHEMQANAASGDAGVQQEQHQQYGEETDRSGERRQQQRHAHFSTLPDSISSAPSWPAEQEEEGSEAYASSRAGELARVRVISQSTAAAVAAAEERELAASLALRGGAISLEGVGLRARVGEQQGMQEGAEAVSSGGYLRGAAAAGGLSSAAAAGEEGAAGFGASGKSISAAAAAAAGGIVPSAFPPSIPAAAGRSPLFRSASMPAERGAGTAVSGFSDRPLSREREELEGFGSGGGVSETQGSARRASLSSFYPSGLHGSGVGEEEEGSAGGGSDMEGHPIPSSVYSYSDKQPKGAVFTGKSILKSQVLTVPSMAPEHSQTLLANMSNLANAGGSASIQLSLPSHALPDAAEAGLRSHSSRAGPTVLRVNAPFAQSSSNADSGSGTARGALFLSADGKLSPRREVAFYPQPSNGGAGADTGKPGLRQEHADGSSAEESGGMSPGGSRKLKAPIKRVPLTASAAYALKELALQEQMERQQALLQEQQARENAAAFARAVGQKLAASGNPSLEELVAVAEIETAEGEEAAAASAAAAASHHHHHHIDSHPHKSFPEHLAAVRGTLSPQEQAEQEAYEARVRQAQMLAARRGPDGGPEVLHPAPPHTTTFVKHRIEADAGLQGFLSAPAFKAGLTEGLHMGEAIRAKHGLQGVGDAAAAAGLLPSGFPSFDSRGKDPRLIPTVPYDPRVPTADLLPRILTRQGRHARMPVGTVSGFRRGATVDGPYSAARAPVRTPSDFNPRSRFAHSGYANGSYVREAALRVIKPMLAAELKIHDIYRASRPILPGMGAAIARATQQQFSSFPQSFAGGAGAGGGAGSAAAAAGDDGGISLSGTVSAAFSSKRGKGGGRTGAAADAPPSLLLNSRFFHERLAEALPADATAVKWHAPPIASPAKPMQYSLEELQASQSGASMSSPAHATLARYIEHLQEQGEITGF